MKATGWYILGGVLAILALALGTLATWALPVNLLIELIVAVLYLRFYWTCKNPRTESTGEAAVLRQYTPENRPAWQPLLTTVLIINLISQPLLWIILGLAANFWGMPLLGLTLLLEVGVWFLEALLLHNMNNQHLRLRDALELSLFMNLTSFGIGLLLAL